MRLPTLQGSLRLFVTAATLAAATAAPLAATTYLPITDESLADLAQLIAEVRVIEASPSPDGVPISTDYTVEIAHVLKGQPVSSSIVVRVPGGQQPSGIGVKVFGAPTFTSGERLLLFLRPAGPGVYVLDQLALGAFRRVELNRQAFWKRDLAGAHRLEVSEESASAGPESFDLRHAEAFAAWLAARARGEQVPGRYRHAPSASELRSVVDEFTLRFNSDHPIRWFAFDEGNPVSWYSTSAGQTGLPGGGHAEVEAALAAWNADPQTNVQYRYAGQSAARGVFNYYNERDGLSMVSFEDSWLGRFDCATGGLASMTWVHTDDRTRTYRGREYHVIYEADVGTLQGTACLFDAIADPRLKSKLAEEIIGHELGHSLSLDDSSRHPLETNARLRGALMYAFPHADGRGARLNNDDRAGLRQLYGTPGPLVCQPSASVLCLAKGRFAVEVDYWNPYDDSRGVGSALRSSDVAGFFSFSGPANIEVAVKILNIGGEYRLFHGALTDLVYSLKVNDLGAWRVWGRSGGAQCGSVGGLGAGTLGTDVNFAAAASAACKPGPNTLCLLSGRYRVEVDWRNQYDGSSGRGRTIRRSDLAGLVYYTQPGNIELVVKVLDLGEEAKVFFAPLSDLEFELHVTDMATGQVRSFENLARPCMETIATSP